jgi:hypothetical protein
MSVGAPNHSLAAGVAAALVGALAGAAAWAVLVSVTDYKIGFAAVGVGALTGLLAGRAGGADPLLPALAAGIGLLGCVVGDLLIDAHALAEAASDIGGQDLSTFTVLKEMLTDPADTGWPVYKAGFEALDLLFYVFATVTAFRLAAQHGTSAPPAPVYPPPGEGSPGGAPTWAPPPADTPPSNPGDHGADHPDRR